MSTIFFQIFFRPLKQVVLATGFSLLLLVNCACNSDHSQLSVNASANNIPEANEVPLSIDQGPGAAAFIANCQTCHTARYSLMQPKLSRAAWGKTVDKMIKIYGAEIDSVTAKVIVDYLVARQ